MPDLDAVDGDRISGEIGEVEREDDLRSRVDCGGENMPVIRVGQAQALDQPLVAGDQRVAGIAIHQVPGPLQLGAMQIRSPLEDATDPLIVDRVVHLGRYTSLTARYINRSRSGAE